MTADPCGCGCCTPASGAAPLPVSNPPGLPAVGYRIGTYPTFREALIRRLAQTVTLRNLTARGDDDYAIAVLDSWSVIADILTFYSERTANEAFLRTAKLRDSVVRLAGLVGYDPNPGLAATANLSYTLDAGTSFTIAAGAKVQSVSPPGSSDPPVKFETLADLAADSALNRVPLVAPPQGVSPLAAGVASGLLAPGSSAPASLRAGASLVAWSSAGGTELKHVDAVTGAGPAGGLAWSPPLTRDQDELVVIARPFRLLGWDAPDSFVTTYYDGSLKELVVTEVENGAGAEINGTPISYDFSVGPADVLDLDADYPDLRPGVDLLICDPASGSTLRTTVLAVTRSNEPFGPIQRTVTRVELSLWTPALDRRTAEVYEIADDVPLWSSSLPAQITGTTVYAALAPGSAPAAGRAVELVDDTQRYDATVVSTAVAPDLPGHVEILLSPGPTAPLDAASAALLGNIVEASQGETVSGELLGTGDSAVPNQRFKVAKPPITRVPRAGAPHGGASTLVVRVSGVQWHEVEYLFGYGATDRVFVVETEDDGSQWVRFGDGTIGSLVPTGAQVTADYRSGLGTAGNVGADTLTTALTRPKGMEAVDNELPAGGGGDPETVDEARASAPTTVRTFERVVSLSDAADQARENAMVGKADAAWTTVAGELGVLVTVAGADGAELGAAQLADVQADLDARRDPNRPLVVRGYTPVALEATVSLIALDPDYAPKDVQNAVTAALLEHFAFATRDFGQPVVLSEVYVAAQRVAGVVGVHVDVLTFRDPAVVFSHFLLPFTLRERIDLNSDELATLAATDLTVLVAT
jgi:hypothetical protein